MASVIENGVEREIIIPKETTDIDYKYKSLELAYRLANDTGTRDGVEFVKGSIRDINEFIVKYNNKEIEDKCYTWFNFVFNAELQLIDENGTLVYNYWKCKDDKEKLKRLAKIVKNCDKYGIGYTECLNFIKDQKERENFYQNDETMGCNIFGNERALKVYEELDKVLKG